jgi:uncharacterized protein (UPF0335 family)
MPSVQLERYLTERAAGRSVSEACFFSGIDAAEAELHEADIASGELELPRAHVRAGAREGDQSGEGTSMDVAADELRLLIERLHEERQGIADDIKDVFAEAKSRGFDTATMKRCIKLRKLEPHALQEADALLSAYLNALGMGEIEQPLGLAA